MGTWAAGSFENDTALDWLNHLHDRPDPELVRAPLSRVLESVESCGSDPEREAVAAADIVACWLGHPPPEPLRVSLVPWAREHLELTPDFVPLAQQAVATIKSGPHLRTLWSDRDGKVREKWLASMEDLERRLQCQERHDTHYA